MTPYQTYHSAAYRRFKAIPPNAFREIVRYYEENETAVGQLDFEEYFEITLAYTEALFECGKYREHLVMADPVLETVIRQNIFLLAEAVKSAVFARESYFYADFSVISRFNLKLIF